jgi:hypothetical protein
MDTGPERAETVGRRRACTRPRLPFTLPNSPRFTPRCRPGVESPPFGISRTCLAIGCRARVLGGTVNQDVAGSSPARGATSQKAGELTRPRPSPSPSRRLKRQAGRRVQRGRSQRASLPARRHDRHGSDDVPGAARARERCPPASSDAEGAPLGRRRRPSLDVVEDRHLEPHRVGA